MTGGMAGRRIRVLVIDDSAYNRQAISSMLEGQARIEVVGRASDGEEGLRLAYQLVPDVITLDLEMPKMDGFSFLRILMAKRPIPVIVISSFATRENVFRALELGALDFVAKPQKQISPELHAIAEDLLAKVQLVTQLRVVQLTERALSASSSAALPTLPPLAPPPMVPVPSGAATATVPVSAAVRGPAPARICAIGASTGGPPAIQQILSMLPANLPLGLVITQHMPVKFTRAFAERLGRITPWNVREAADGDYLVAGTALVAPGSHSLQVRREGLHLRVQLAAPSADDRYVPSVDRMLESVARHMGPAAMAVILTGMGGDGGRGVRVIKAAGGRVLAEAPETAVIFGMPQEAIASGSVDDIVPLGAIADAISRFTKS